MTTTPGHFQLPLLPLPAAQGGYGGKAYLANAKAINKTVARINGSLKMAGRTELAVVPMSPDFFGTDNGMAHVRALAWQIVKDSPNLIWTFITRNPQAIKASLPQDWIGAGYKNVVFGTAPNTADDLPAMVQALGQVPAHNRMLLLYPTMAAIDLAGHLAGLNWVAMAGDASEGMAPVGIAETCAAANVPFAWFQTDHGFEPTLAAEFQVEALPHPFGTKVLLDRPTLPGIIPALEEIHALAAFPTSVSAAPNTEPSLPTMSYSSQFPPMQSDACRQIETTDELPPAAQEIEVEVVEDASADDRPSQTEMMVVASCDDAGSEPMLADDMADYVRLDALVRANLRAFQEAGWALVEIRDRELWRHGPFQSWAEYCQAVGGISKQHANRLILSAEIVQDIAKVEPIGSTLPLAESQVRPLGRLDTPDQRSAAWNRAVERAGGQPTAKDVTAVVAELLRDKRRQQPPATPDNRPLLINAFKRFRKAVIDCDQRECVAELIGKLERLLKL